MFFMIPSVPPPPPPNKEPLVAPFYQAWSKVQDNAHTQVCSWVRCGLCNREQCECLGEKPQPQRQDAFPQTDI